MTRMYVVTKKETFKEEDTDTIFAITYHVSTYEKALLLAAYEVVKHVYDNSFLHSQYSVDDVHYLLSEDPKKILMWLTDTGSEFFKSYNMAFEVWVHLETNTGEQEVEITTQDLKEISNRLQKKLLGKNTAEG